MSSKVAHIFQDPKATSRKIDIVGSPEELWEVESLVLKPKCLCGEEWKFAKRGNRNSIHDRVLNIVVYIIMNILYIDFKL